MTFCGPVQSASMEARIENTHATRVVAISLGGKQQKHCHHKLQNLWFHQQSQQDWHLLLVNILKQHQRLYLRRIPILSPKMNILCWTLLVQPKLHLN